MLKAEKVVHANQLRIGARLKIEEALERIRVQPQATAVWLELDQDCGEQMDALISQVSHDVSRGLYAAVISSTAPLLDKVSARIDEDDVEVIVDANDLERATALALRSHARTHLFECWTSERTIALSGFDNSAKK